MSRGLTAMLALLVGGASLGACSLSVAPREFEQLEDEPGALPSTDRCGYRLPEDDACALCQSERCCDALTACKGEPACDGMLECVSRCMRLDAAAECRTACLRGADPDPRGAISQVVDCLGDRCNDQCGGCAGLSFITGDACGECIERANACDDLTSCLEEIECRAGYICGVTCDDPACILECIEGDSDAVRTQLIDLFDRLRTGCSGGCAIGSAWECVDDYTWSVTKDAAEVELVVQVLRLTPGEPADGITFRLCGETDIPCNQPLDTQTTGEDGRAALTVPVAAASQGYRGFMLVEGVPGGVEDGDAIVPMVFQNDRPILEASFYQVLVTTPGELASLAALSGVAGGVEPDAAQVGLLVRDCLSASAGDVTVGLEVDGRSYEALYTRDGLPDPTATSTDASGAALFFNVAVPTADPFIGVVVATHAESVRTLRRRPIGVRQGWLSSVFLNPTPSD